MNNENSLPHANASAFACSSDQNQMISLASSQITNEKLSELLAQIEDYERVSVVNKRLFLNLV